MLSVPPLFGAPVPGLSAWKPAVGACGPVELGPDPLVDELLLHAAASIVRAAAPTMAL
jgi:hypothetical protein